MVENFEVKSSAERVKGDAADERDARLAKIREKKAADEASAAEVVRERQAAEEEAARAEAQRQAAEEEARQAAEETARKKAEAQREAVQKIGSAALAAGGAVVGSAAERARKGELKASPKTVFFAIAAIVIIALLLFLAWPRISAMLSPQPEPESQTYTTTQMESPNVMANTAAEIHEAILGEARQKSELVVWEQDVQVESQITQALANLSIFKKTKTVHSFGTGVYTVDMGKIDDAAITIIEDSHIVTIQIPHAKLSYVTKDLAKTEFEDTQHALLGFGEIKLIQEQQNILEQSIEDAMRAELEAEGCLADADDAALLVVYDVYQPLVAKVDPSFTLDVRFLE